MAEAVQVVGLDGLVRAFRRLEPDLRARLRGELKDLAGVVAEEAQAVAAQRGLRDTGQLIAKIKPAVVRGTTAVVRDTAVRTRGTGAPFPYPRLYEFAKGRPFMEPALERKTEAVIRGLELMLDRLAGDEGF